MENQANKKSGAQRAAQGLRVLKGAAQIGSGIATGNFVAVARGATKVLSPKVIAIILCTLIFILLLPIIILCSLPQMLLNWTDMGVQSLDARSTHGTVIAQHLTDTINTLPENAKPDYHWLVAIESVRVKQDVESITYADVENCVSNSYGYNEDGELYRKTPDEMMDDLGFTEDEKNWATLLYKTMNNQYLEPGDIYGDIDGLSGYEGVTLGQTGETEVVYYSQTDQRWSDIMYGKSSTIGAAGCGPTSLAIAVSTLTEKTVDPPTVCAWSVRNGHRCEGNGSYHSLIPEGAKHYGLKVDKLGKSNAKELARHLSEGHLVIAIMDKGHFTKNGHFIVLRGITETGKVLVADPASYKRSEQEWDMSIILSEARKDATAGGPFWALY